MRRIMVKITAMALVFALSLVFAGCKKIGLDLGKLLPGGNRGDMESSMVGAVVAGDDYSTDDTDPSEDVPAKDPTIADFTELLKFLNTSFEGTYGAEADMTQPHSRIFTSQESCMNGDDPVEVRAGILSMDESNDPAAMVLYPVTNVKTLAQWKESLAQKFSVDMITKWETEQDVLAEYSGKLYMLRGGQGYGAWLLELDTAKIVSQSTGACSVTVDCLAFGEYECTYQVDFVYSDGRWIINNYYTI